MAGDFPTDWQLTPIENCMEAIIDYRGKTPRKTTFGIPLITAKVVKGGRIETPDEFIDSSEYDAWMRRGLPRTGDVLVTTEAPLGEVAQVGNPKVALAQRLIALRGGKGRLNNTFLKFLMQSAFVQSQLKARATGTTVLGIKQSELRKVMLPLPKLAEQQAIACILGALDDKIELNRRMNRTLEGLARAIFRSWFVDFDPVRAKAAGKKPAGLQTEIAKLFPNSFEDSELGEIPKGWTVTAIGDFSAKITDGSHRSPPSVDEGLPMASVKDMTNWGITISTCRHISESDFDLLAANDCRPMAGDVLLAKDGATCLETAVEYRQEDNIVVLSSIAILRPRRLIEASYLHLWLTSESTKSYLREGFVSGSAIPRVVLKDLRRAKLLCPSDSILHAFSRIVEPLRARLRANYRGSISLAALRDALLPKLISGELRVLDAKRIVGRCV